MGSLPELQQQRAHSKWLLLRVAAGGGEGGAAKRERSNTNCCSILSVLVRIVWEATAERRTGWGVVLSSIRRKARENGGWHAMGCSASEGCCVPYWRSLVKSNAPLRRPRATGSCR